MYVAVAASRPRCLVVALGLTAALRGAAAVLVRGLTAGQPATPDAALVRLCLVALLVAVGWAWLQGLAGVVDAWRGSVGHPHPGHRGLRRLAMAVCGVALAGSLGTPAHADPGQPAPALLSGLPLPDRPEGSAHAHAHARDAAPQSVVVRTGDSLWALAERDLPPGAGAPEITAGWHQIYRDNRAVIGGDPDLIRPGQVLRLSKEHR